MPGAVTNGSRAGEADDIVLTGLSGRLPESNNIEEFAQQLFDGVDLVTADDRRWTPGKYFLFYMCLFITSDLRPSVLFK